MALTQANTDMYVKRVELPGLVGTTVTVTDKASGGSIGTAATTVDVASAINVNQTTASQTLTIPSPTNTTNSTTITFNNIGSTSFTVLSTVIAPGAGIMIDWTGSAWSVIGTSSGASNVVVVGGKTFTVNNTLTLSGTDSTTMTFPTTSATLARTDAANTFTGVQTMTSAVLTTPAITTPSIATGLSASGSASNDFSASTGTFKTSSGANQLSGAVTITDATTPSITTAAGKTNTGFVQINGKTSGALKIIAADSAAQTVTISLAAQTTGAATLTIPDMANTAGTMVITNVTQTLTNKTLTSPTLTTPSLGVATATSINGNTFTTGTYTLTGQAGKTLTFNGSITLTGTDAQTYTFPTTSATLARTDAANTFTGVQTMTSPVLTTPAIGVATGTSFTATGAIVSTGTAGVGYATGAGGTISQATDKSTGVTLSKTCGSITLNAANLAAATIVSFTLTNTTIAATDVLVLNHISAGTSGAYTLNAQCGSGTATISVRNNTAGGLAEAIVLQFVVVKAVTS